MIKAYRYKIKPTMKQQKQLSQMFGCVRFIYNWGLNRKVEAYKKDKTSIGYVQLAKELTQFKKQENVSWLNECSLEALQQSLRCLDNAYTRFFKQKKGFPKFKSKKNHKDSVKFIKCVHFDFNTWKVKVPKIGWVKLCENQIWNQATCKQGTLTITRDSCGTYWCSIVIDDMQTQKPKAKVSEETAVGIDLGIKDYAILSDGTKYGNPKFLEKGQSEIKRLQMWLSKKQKNSKNRERLRLKIAKKYRAIANRRSDFCHKLSTLLISNFDTICIEDLNVQGMEKNHHLANSIQSCAWTTFRNMLVYKSEREGKNVIFIGRFEPSSKTCSECGYINKDLSLSDREWICPKCGTHHDRDINAAVNIKDFGLHPQSLASSQQCLNIFAHRQVGLTDSEGVGYEPYEESI